MSKAGISIVIPAYNEEKFLPATLSAADEALCIFSNATGLPGEVIVVDNISTDHTEKIARQYKAKVIRHEVRNISSVRNAGIRSAAYSVIVTIDADCFLPLDSLEKIWKFMADDQSVGAALGVRFISNQYLNKAVAGGIKALANLTSGINGAMFCFRKDVAMEIGGFPENRLIAEDAVFAILMRKYAKKNGKIFGRLKSVQVGTLDRKDMSLRQLFPLLLQVAKAFAGKRQSLEDLKFWYDPDR